MTTASIIGFGTFGQFIAKQLTPYLDLKAWSITDHSQEAVALGIPFVSLEEACAQEVVILSVAMEHTEAMIAQIAPLLKQQALVLDMCSLKTFACEAMDRLLPPHVAIVGTHPLFGPQSCPESIAGRNIALCDVRGRKLDDVKTFCEQLGLKVHVTTPEEHDRQMAYSQSLTHFIGAITRRLGITEVSLSTKTFEEFLNISRITGDDSKTLFRNIQLMNPYAREVRERFVKEAEKLRDELR